VDRSSSYGPVIDASDVIRLVGQHPPFDVLKLVQRLQAFYQATVGGRPNEIGVRRGNVAAAHR